MGRPAVTEEQWAHLVWYALAVHDDGRQPPAFAVMGRAAGVTSVAAKLAWYDGLPHLPNGGTSIREIRRRVSGGELPFPPQPPGAAPATSRLADLAKKGFAIVGGKVRKKAPPAAPARTLAPPAPPPPDDADDDGDGDPWGGAVPDDVAGALKEVAFPAEPAPPPSPRPRPIPRAAHAAAHQAKRDAAADRLDPVSQGLVDGAEGRADQPFDPAEAVDDTPALPSEIAAAAPEPPPPIPREHAERVLLEARLDAIEIAARARRTTAMAVYAAQNVMSGMVPLSKRVRHELVELARSPEKLDPAQTLSLLQRATQMARSVSTVANNVMAISKDVTDDLRVYVKALDGTMPGTAEGGVSSDGELLAELRHQQERLGRDAERLARKMQAGDGPPPEAPAPARERSPAERLAAVLTAEAIARLADIDTRRRGEEYAAGGHVRTMAMVDGALVGIVVGQADYVARLWANGEELACACTCPQGQLGRRCKHVVALGFACLQGGGPFAGACTGEDPGEAAGGPGDTQAEIRPDTEETQHGGADDDGHGDAGDDGGEREGA